MCTKSHDQAKERPHLYHQMVGFLGHDCLNMVTEEDLPLLRCRVSGAGGPIGSITEGDVVTDSLKGMTVREDLRNLAIVAHVGEEEGGGKSGHLEGLSG